MLRWVREHPEAPVLAGVGVVGWCYALHLRDKQHERQVLAQERATLLRERELLAEERLSVCAEREALLDVIRQGDTSRPEDTQASGLPSPETIPAPKPAGPDKGEIERPLVVISYQSRQLEFLNKLVHALAELGIRTIDGSRVPVGGDWRRFFFPSLSRAVVFVPILSDSFLFSAACEDEITYAWDKRKVILPVLYDLEPFARVLSAPEAYVHKRADIQEVVPKLESFLNQCNRTPAEGKFEEHWDANVAKLAGAIQDNLRAHQGEARASVGPSPGIMLRSESGHQPHRSKSNQEHNMLHLLAALRQPGQDHVGILGDLRFISRAPQNVEQAVYAGAVPLLVSMLHGDTAEDAAAVLRNLTGPPDDASIQGYLTEHRAVWSSAKLLLADTGALPAVVRCLQPDQTIEASVHAANIVRHCSFLQGPEHNLYLKQRIQQAGALPQLVRMLRCGGKQAAHAAAAISLVIYQVDSVQAELLQLGALEAVTPLLGSPDSLLVEKACWVLKALVRNHHSPEPKVEVARRAAQAGVCAEVAVLLGRSGSGESQFAVDQALQLLAKFLLNNSDEVVLENAIASQLLPQLIRFVSAGGKTTQGQGLVEAVAATTLYRLAAHQVSASHVAGYMPELTAKLTKGPLLALQHGEGDGEECELYSETIMAVCRNVTEAQQQRLCEHLGVKFEAVDDLSSLLERQVRAIVKSTRAIVEDVRVVWRVGRLPRSDSRSK